MNSEQSGFDTKSNNRHTKQINPTIQVKNPTEVVYTAVSQTRASPCETAEHNKGECKAYSRNQ